MKLLIWIREFFKRLTSSKDPISDNNAEISAPYKPVDPIIGESNKNFNFAFEYTMVNEGGWSDEPTDQPTKYGIIADDLIRLGLPHSKADIKALTLDQVKPMYKKLYWDELDLDKIDNKAIACALFDIGVVRGVGIPPKYCTQLYGVYSAEKLNKVNPIEFLDRYSALCSLGFRQIVYKNPTKIVYLNGWLRRANRLLDLKAHAL